MMTGRQIRAGRALLDWKAEDLAKEAGLTRATISKIESEQVQPQEKTMGQIGAAFDRFGIEFTDDEGVKIRKSQVRIFVGKEGYKHFLDHIYYVVKEGGFLCQFNVSDQTNLPFAGEYGRFHLERMAALRNLDARVLAPEGDTAFLAPYCQYRWLPKAQGVLAPYYLYNDVLEMTVYRADHSIEIIAIDSKQLVQRAKAQFDFYWDQALIPQN